MAVGACAADLDALALSQVPDKNQREQEKNSQQRECGAGHDFSCELVCVDRRAMLSPEDSPNMPPYALRVNPVLDGCEMRLLLATCCFAFLRRHVRVIGEASDHVVITGRVEIDTLNEQLLPKVFIHY